MSYAWAKDEHERRFERWVEQRLATDLDKAGISVILDRWENAHPGASIPRFVDRISEADRVLIVGTPGYLRKFKNKDPKTGTVVAAEMDQVSARLLGTEEQKKTVIPLLLEGKRQEAFPPSLVTRVYSDFRDDSRYFEVALSLLLSLYGIGPREPEAIHWREQLGGGRVERRDLVIGDDEDTPTDEEVRGALRRVGSGALHAAFDANKPVVVEQAGKLVWLYSDGTTKPYVARAHPGSGAAT